jgi:MFS family permease
MRNIRLLFLAQFLNGLFFAAPFYTLFLLAQHLSFAQILGLESIRFFAGMLFELPTGLFADRYGRKWSIICSSLFNLLSWMAWFSGNTFFFYGLSYALWGIGSAFLSGSLQAFLYDDLQDRQKQTEMQKVYGAFLATGTFAFAIASLLGGIFIDGTSSPHMHYAFILTAGIQTISFILHFFLKEPPKTTSHIHHTSFFIVAQSAYTCLRSNAQFRTLFCLSLFTNPLSLILFYLIQPYFLSLTIPVQWLGVLFFCSSMMTAGAKIFCHRLEEFIGIRLLFLCLTFLPGILWILLGINHHWHFPLFLPRYQRQYS